MILLTMDVTGFAGPIGPIADGANAILSSVQGDFAGAAIIAAAMISAAGDALKAGKMAKNAVRFSDEKSAASRYGKSRLTDGDHRG